MKYTVEKTDSWKLYTPLVPQGMTMLGTVRRGADAAGALALDESTGRYVQLNAGACRNLDQRKVKEALATLKKRQATSPA